MQDDLLPLLEIFSSILRLDTLVSPRSNNADKLRRLNLIRYLVAEHKDDCWAKCGRRNRWSGKCSYCNLSNGSPGFCCHPDGRGSGCTGGMIRAVRNARLGRKYQCVVPKEFDSVASTSLKVLEKRDCWAKCGAIKGFAGKCDYCGPQGYCCNADGRGQCPGQMSTLLAVQGIRGNRCVVPATTMGDHRLETSARSRCKSKKVSQCRTLSSFINGKQSFNRQRNRNKKFSMGNFTI